jgi:RNA polymerase sigma-70 factor (ECF subfamily)
MASDAALSAAFESHRAYLLRVAYGTLGSVADAEDVVQEAWLRLARLQDPGVIEDLRAWLTRVVGRLALDALRRARHTREQYVGEWLPEPLVSGGSAAIAGAAARVGPGTGSGPGGGDPVDRVTLDESVTMALLVVLERLSPAERTAFVLHDVFGMPFEDVGDVVGRAPAAVRQLAARARRHVDEARPRHPATREDHRRVVEAFAVACAEGDLDALLATLGEDVVWRSDGGGHVTAMRYPLHGRDRVAKAALGFARRAPQASVPALVNGWPGLVERDSRGILTVMSFTLDDSRIVGIEAVRNPDKLTHVDLL